MTTLIKVIVVTFALVCQAMCWDQSDRDQIIKMHNDYRRGTVREKGACHMNKMSYDMDMEKDAEAYAKKCVYQHKFEKYGENFAYDTRQKSQTEKIKLSVDSWYSEIKNYDYNQKACGPSKTCHYTQLVASKTNKIGCYAHKCANLAKAVPNAWFFVCYYTPKGNWVGEKTYPKDCKEPCSKGQTEEDGLCLGEAEEEEKKIECKDENPNYCKVWKKNGQCELNKSNMHKHCPVTCGVCKPEGPVEEFDSCIDNDPRCPDFQKRGECTRRADQMKRRCPKSCKFC